MRRPLALLALFVTTWSNAAVLRCSAMTPVSEESQASATHHAHAGHAAPAPSTYGDKDDAAANGEPRSPHTQECGLVMACGTALNGAGATPHQELPGPLGAILHAPAAAPTAVDLSQEPPPPRRLA